jgi:hypothetical protein
MVTQKGNSYSIESYCSDCLNYYYDVEMNEYAKSIPYNELSKEDKEIYSTLLNTFKERDITYRLGDVVYGSEIDHSWKYDVVRNYLYISLQKEDLEDLSKCEDLSYVELSEYLKWDECDKLFPIDEIIEQLEKGWGIDIHGKED